APPRLEVRGVTLQLQWYRLMGSKSDEVLCGCQRAQTFRERGVVKAPYTSLQNAQSITASVTCWRRTQPAPSSSVGLPSTFIRCRRLDVARGVRRPASCQGKPVWNV